MNFIQIVAVLAASIFLALMVAWTHRWHVLWTGDFAAVGVQKHHTGSPPRVGIVPIGAGVSSGVLLLFTGDLSSPASADCAQAARYLLLILVASLPVVALGLAEDITERIPARARLIAAAVSAAAAIVLLGTRVVRVDVPGLEGLVTYAPVSVLLTLLVVSGHTHAMNIVDGLNGLTGGIAVLGLSATAFVCWRLGDAVLVDVCIVLALSVAGFLVLNFPHGRVFMGDGGAYFEGFALVQVWLLLLSRHPEVSPWYVVAVAFHPTMETVFSIYRRKLQRARLGGVMSADRLHLHSLLYHRRALPFARRRPGCRAGRPTPCPRWRWRASQRCQWRRPWWRLPMPFGASGWFARQQRCMSVGSGCW